MGVASECSIFHSYNTLHIVCPQQPEEALRHTTKHLVRYHITSFNYIYNKRHKLHAVYTSVIGGAVIHVHIKNNKSYKRWYHPPSHRQMSMCCWVIPLFTALHVMQTRYSEENSVRPSVRLSVCLSVTRMIPGKTKERSVQIFIPYERIFISLFWEEEWLVGGDPF